MVAPTVKDFLFVSDESATVKRPLKKIFFMFWGKKSSFEAVLSQQDTIAQVFDTRYGKTNVGPNHSRKENFLRPLAS